MKAAKTSIQDAEVLVVAPRFPSINQPWMDTYLEQLQRHGIRFCVATGIETPGNYHDKVDRLGLREYVVDVELGTRAVLSSCLRHLVCHPIEFLRRLGTTWHDLASLGSGKQRLALVLRNLHVLFFLQKLSELRAVHLHATGFGFHFLSLAAEKGAPLVLTFHGLMPRGVPQVDPRRRQALFDAAAVVLVNTHYAAQQAEALGCSRAKLLVLPQGLPLEDFAFVPRSPPAPGGVLELLTVGRFHRDKGQGYCLLALRRLLDEGINARWTFVGVGPDRAFLERLADRLGLQGRVRFLEGVSPLPLYHQCHLFVLASVDHFDMEQHVETQGVVLQEAQACGCIPIATAVGGIPECINDGLDGVLVKDRSHRAIAKAIKTLLERPGEWRAFQCRGRENVEQHFSSEVIGTRMAGILRELADQGRATKA